ncbi:MAG: OmpA family protein [Spirochaetia bacterium]|nr:OmpA family protein [Spirochaetia bacterium]
MYVLFSFVYSQENAENKIPETLENDAELIHFGPEINSPYSEYLPFISPDEDIIFFQSDRPGGAGQTGDFDIWSSVNQNKKNLYPQFSSPENIGHPINTPNYEGLASFRKLADNEWEIYFTSVPSQERSGPAGTNIYYSRTTQGKWSNPEPIIGVNTHFNDRMPSISLDGRYLYFSSDRPGGYGKDDLWVSEYDFERKFWNNPVNLGSKINSPASEISSSIHTDGMTLYYSSNKKGGVGGYDIYVTQKISQKDMQSWRNPANLGTPYNSKYDDEHPSVNFGGAYMYFCSNREGGYGAFDIYRARIPHFAKPLVVISLEGRIHEEDSLKGIEANISIESSDDSRNISTGLPDGNFSANFINNKIYKILVSAPGYYPQEFTFDLREIHIPQVIRKDFHLKKQTGLPSKFSFYISFYDKENKFVGPNVTYSINSSLKTKVKPSSVPEKNEVYYIINMPVPIELKDKENLVNYLQENIIKVQALHKGFLRLEREIAPVHIVDLSEIPIKENYDIRFMMQEGDSGITEEPETVIEETQKIKHILSVYFNTNMFENIRNSKDDILEEIAKAWIESPDVYLEVHGHTDAEGSLKHNIWLSKQRALSIKNKLIKLGIDEKHIIQKWYADKRPASTNLTDDGRAKNRRVEIYLVPSNNGI